MKSEELAIGEYTRVKVISGKHAGRVGRYDNDKIDDGYEQDDVEAPSQAVVYLDGDGDRATLIAYSSLKKIPYENVCDIPEEKREIVLAEALALIRQLRMYARIGHNKPKDYQELCDTFACTHNIKLGI